MLFFKQKSTDEYYYYLTIGLTIISTFSFLYFIIISTQLFTTIQKTKSDIVLEHDAQNSLFAQRIANYLTTFKKIPDQINQKINSPSLNSDITSLLNQHASLSGIIIQHQSTTKSWYCSPKNEISIISFNPDGINNGFSNPQAHTPFGSSVLFFQESYNNNIIIIAIDLEILKKEINAARSSYLAHVVITNTDNTTIIGDSNTQKTYNFFTHFIKQRSCDIPSSTWTLTTSFFPKNIPVSPIRKLILLLICSLTCTIICISFIFFILYEYSVFMAATSVSIILFLANCAAWTAIYQLPINQIDINNRINDPLVCNQFIANQIETAQKIRCNKPVFSEVGLLVQSMDLNQESNSQIDILMWQHINNQTNSPITLLHNEGDEGKEITNNDKESPRMWIFNTKITTPDDETYYPFHTCYMKIELVSTNHNSNQILIPDASMRYLPHSPWLSSSLQYSGYYLEDSFITSEPRNEEAVQQYFYPLHNKLCFHFVFKEALTGAILNYILPFLIILFAIFGLLFFGEFSQDRFAGYTATSFVAVLLHGSLRTVRKIATVSYLDFFFLHTYLTTLICMLIALLIMNDPKYKKYDVAMQYCYWPIQFFLWLITTTLMFY